ncbi:MAG: FecR family protein [Bacteroidota bacterium]
MEDNRTIVVDDHLMVRYLAGHASPEEALALHDWLLAPANKKQFDELAATWNATRPSQAVDTGDSAHAWEKVSTQLTDAPRTPIIHPMVWRIAASVLLVAVVGLLLYQRNNNEELTKIATHDRIENVVLPDSSTVTLYHNTAVEYQPSFKGNTRGVNLTSGEAFFSIAHNATKPFIVHTSLGDIKVVGTEFNVTVEDGRLEVAVHSGKVIVYHKTDSVSLEKGFAGVVKPGDEAIEVRDSFDANSSAYATRMLVFSDRPLNEVVRDIEKAYPCRIVFANDGIRNCRLTATFDHDSPQNILNLVAETLNLSVEQNGTLFTLKGEGCP